LSPEYFSAEKFLPARLFTGSAMRQKTLSQRFLILVVMLEKEKRPRVPGRQYNF
jgi:hypothetical protein